MIHSCRPGEDHQPFPGRMRCYDKTTGHYIPCVFHYDTETHRTGRLATDASGAILLTREAGAWETSEVWEERQLGFEPIPAAEPRGAVNFATEDGQVFQLLPFVSEP